jgi:CRP-like cAMP-binding protein
MAQVAHPNHLLASLAAADFELIRSHLRTVELVHEAVLFETGDQVSRVYFPHTGVISLVIDLAEGVMIEAAMVGRDSVVGASSVLDGLVSLNKAIVQVPGIASVLEVGHLRKAADQSVEFRTALMRHEQALFAQVQQTAACNASHSVEARMARWLLRARDLVDGETLMLTQEFFAQMLGVRRTSVSLVAHTLQETGLIRYRRGRIEITDLAGMRNAACECYGTVKSHHDRLVNCPKKTLSGSHDNQRALVASS